MQRRHEGFMRREQKAKPAADNSGAGFVTFRPVIRDWHEAVAGKAAEPN